MASEEEEVRMSSPVVAFPGAEGFGSITRHAYAGGVDPVIYKVTNLNASGPGSLREALETATEPRIVVFEVSGTITLTDYIWVMNPYVFVAGQTAPSPGITLHGPGLFIQTHDVVIQHLRIRTGDEPGEVECNWRDCLQISGFNTIIDHCSLSWATDENTSCGPWDSGEGYKYTYQWCIVSEGLNDSCHPSGPHSGGMLASPNSTWLSIHHNLFAHNLSRNPTVGAVGETEIINNLVYNWEWNATQFQHYTGYGPQYGNVIGNYYKAGINTQNPLNERAIHVPSGIEPQSLFYIHSNIGPSRPTDEEDDWNIVWGDEILRSNTPTFTPTGITTQNVFDVPDLILSQAGARPVDRDSVDTRIIQEVINGTGQAIDSQNDVGGWPILQENHRELVIPDNPHADSGNGYTNLEMWLSAFAKEVEGIELELCDWIASKGGPTALTVADVFVIIDSYLYEAPPSGYTFVPTLQNVFGVIDYYLGFDGDAATGCDFFP